MTSGYPPQGLPNYQSQLAQQIQTQNFVAIQSGKLLVSNAGSTGSRSIQFTNIPGTNRVTAKITNSGSKGCYIASGAGSATAIVSQDATVLPTVSSGSAVATCDFIASGAILTQDYIQGTDTWAFICGGSDTTTVEVSVGFGQ